MTEQSIEAATEEEFPGAEEAFESLRATLKAIPEDEVEPFQGLVRRIVTNVLQMAQTYAKDKPLFLKVFAPPPPGASEEEKKKRPRWFDAEGVSDIGPRGLTVWQTYSLLRHHLNTTETVPELVALAVPDRKELLDGLGYAWRNDKKRTEELKKVRRGRGHYDTADDLIVMVAMAKDDLAHVLDESGITKELLDRCAELGKKIVTLIKQKVTPEEAAVRDWYDRAGGYCLEAAYEIRDAAEFVFRDQPERLEGYPLPQSPLRPRKSPSPDPSKKK